MVRNDAFIVAVALATAFAANLQAQNANPEAKAPAAEAASADPPVGAFDPNDPKVMELRKLEYKDINLEEVDAHTKQMAAMALSELLGVHGTLAKERVKQLRAFLSEKGLEIEYSKWAKDHPLEYQSLSFEDAAKLAVAYVRTPLGEGDYSNRLLGVNDDVKHRMFDALVSNCRRVFPEVRENRRTVESIARYLDSKDMFEAYLTWAEGHVEKEKQERQERMAELREKAEQEDAARRELMLEMRREKDARDHEMKMKRMEYAYSLKEQQVKSAAEINKARYQRSYNRYDGYRGDVYYRRYYRR